MDPIGIMTLSDSNFLNGDEFERAVTQRYIECQLDRRPPVEELKTMLDWAFTTRREASMLDALVRGEARMRFDREGLLQFHLVP